MSIYVIFGIVGVSCFVLALVIILAVVFSGSKKSSKRGESRKKSSVKKASNKSTVKDKIKLQKEANKSAKSNVQKNLSKAKNKKRSSVRFERVHMWFYYLAAMITKDIGAIPDNIGNRILISSNMYTTKLWLNSIIQITELGMKTPITTFQLLNDYLREKGCSAIVDVTIKRQLMNLSPKDSGLESRKRTWSLQLDKDFILDKQKEMAARCIYTTEQLEKGVKLYYTRIFLTLRAKTGTELMLAERLVGEWIASIGGSYLPITATVKHTLEYISIISDKTSREVKDIKAVITSNLTLAQMMPNTSAFNGEKGVYMGVNILNNTHFNLDFEKITVARNLYLIAPSGVGKTVLAIGFVCSCLEKSNWRVFINDIKGNEWMSICKSVGGLALSLTPLSKQYINSFKMNHDHVDHEHAEEYFTDNFNLSKETMITLTGADDADVINEMDQLIEQFLNTVYNGLGVLPNNKNTWHNTADLDPYEVYDLFVDYMTPTMIKKYPLAGERMINTLKKTMSREGSKSFIFKEEFNMYDVFMSKCVVANFGMLRYSQISEVDKPIFKLKFAYAQRIKASYVQYNYNNKFETLVIDEESQIVPPETMHTYIEDFTLRRAQRQTTFLLGNSIQALLDNSISKPLIENVRGILIGTLPREAREQVIHQFDLEDKRDLLMKVGSSAEFANSFLFVNNMESNPVVPILKLILDEEKAKSHKYIAFTPTKDMSGNS